MSPEDQLILLVVSVIVGIVAYVITRVISDRRAVCAVSFMIGALAAIVALVAIGMDQFTPMLQRFGGIAVASWVCCVIVAIEQGLAKPVYEAPPVKAPEVLQVAEPPAKYEPSPEERLEEILRKNRE